MRYFQFNRLRLWGKLRRRRKSARKFIQKKQQLPDENLGGWKEEEQQAGQKFRLGKLKNMQNKFNFKLFKLMPNMKLNNLQLS